MRWPHGIALCLALLAVPPAVFGEDLIQVYRDAKSYDAQFASARFALDAGRERLPQGDAQYRPTVGLTAGSSRTKQNLESSNSLLFPSSDRQYRTNAYQLTLTQPLWRRQNFLLASEAEWQVKQAESSFGQAGQDLILRVSQAYFDVLASQDSLALVGAQKAAISEQLAQAKRNFEVGTATITDTHEAQARYDLIVAQELAAQNDLENKRQALFQLTGKQYGALKPLRPQIVLGGPDPANMQTWVDMAEKQSYAVQILEAAAEVAQLEAKRASGAHHPTLDFVATYGYTSQSGTALTSIGSDVTVSTLGVQLAVPIYQGGALNSREREAAANYNKSREDLQAAKRTAALTARQSYLGVLSGQAQVKALEQALVSSQSALDSNKLGYEVGARINIDVLNAQQQLFSTMRDLALSRYNTITGQLKLKAAAGSLREEDLEEVNRALADQ
jgi:outer membrane protein